MFKKLLKLLKKPKVIFLVAVIVLALAAAPFLVKWANPHRDGMANGGNEIVFFHMTGCGHCEKMKPEWDKFVNGNPDVSSRMVEAKEGDEANKLGITSYPTILMLNSSGEKVADFGDSGNSDFNGSRNAAAFKTFYDKNQ